LPPNPPPILGDWTTTWFRGSPRISATMAWISVGCCVDELTKTDPPSPASAQAAWVSR
jgi:hypothetical protein